MSLFLQVWGMLLGGRFLSLLWLRKNSCLSRNATCLSSQLQPTSVTCVHRTDSLASTILLVSKEQEKDLLSAWCHDNFGDIVISTVTTLSRIRHGLKKIRSVGLWVLLEQWWPYSVSVNHHYNIHLLQNTDNKFAVAHLPGQVYELFCESQIGSTFYVCHCCAACNIMLYCISTVKSPI